MKIIFNYLIKLIRKILFLDWNGLDLNYKSINYIVGHYRLFELIKDTPGHIIELGTGSGRNSIIFGQLIKLFHVNHKKVFGFDTFEGYPEKVLKSNKNFDPKSFSNFSLKDVKLRLIQNNLDTDVHLIKGILPKSLNDFLNERKYEFSPDGLKISLIYIDCNDFNTAKESLLVLRKYLSKGSIIAVDENRLGGETKAIQYFSDIVGIPVKQWNSGGVITSYIKII